RKSPAHAATAALHGNSARPDEQETRGLLHIVAPAWQSRERLMRIRSFAIARALVAMAVVGACSAPPSSAALQKSFISLPEILTDPNEGNTYGFLQVVLFLDE